MNKEYADIAMGDTADFVTTISSEFVQQFAELSGDRNPLHMDESYAKETRFGQRIAHGMIVGSLFSQLIGMHLPGTYAAYLSQTLKFHEPVFIGTEVRIVGEVIHKTDATKTIMVRTVAEDVTSRKILVSGEAMVHMLQ